MNATSTLAVIIASILGLGIGFAAMNHELLISRLNTAIARLDDAPISDAPVATKSTKVSATKKEVSKTNEVPERESASSKKERAFAKMEAFVKKDPNDRERAIKYGAFLVKKKEYERAKLFYREYLAAHPEDDAALYGLGWAFEQSKFLSDAIQSYERAVELNPRNVAAKNNLAWVLATAPDDSMRDGVRAVKLAKEAIRIAGLKTFLYDTIAAAYAETGDFGLAIRAEREALKRAPASKRETIRARLQMYRQGQPYRSE